MQHGFVDKLAPHISSLQIATQKTGHQCSAEAGDNLNDKIGM
jgi:hypothetical protein